MSTEMNEFNTWVNTELNERNWGYNDLAKRAGLSSSAISSMMTGQRNPGLQSCVKIAKAFDIPPEQVLRIAGLLPPELAPVTDEKEALSIFRNLPDQIRITALTILRALGTQANPVAAFDTLIEHQPTYQVERQPLTLKQRLARDIAQMAEDLPESDVQTVFDLMKRLRGDTGEISDAAPMDAN